jgi:hypothetical protein
MRYAREKEKPGCNEIARANKLETAKPNKECNEERATETSNSKLTRNHNQTHYPKRKKTRPLGKSVETPQYEIGVSTKNYKIAMNN